MDTIEQYGFVGIVSFGLTYMTEVIWKKYRKPEQEFSSLTKMFLQGAFAFVLLFVPLDMQHVVLNNIKLAVGVVAGSSALWRVVKAL